MIKNHLELPKPFTVHFTQQVVSKGDVVVQLDDRQEKLALKVPESEVDSARADFEGMFHGIVYPAHREMLDFGIGRIERDQVEDYARRKEMSRMSRHARYRRNWQARSR